MEKIFYTCESCGNVYKKGLSNEEANKEAEELFGVENASEKPEEMALICDYCFKNRTRKEVKKMGNEYKNNMKDYNKQKRAKLISDKLDELNPAKSSLMYWGILIALVAGFLIGYFTGHIDILLVK